MPQPLSEATLKSNAEVAKAVREFVEKASIFVEVMARNDIEVQLPEQPSSGPDYGAPAIDSYKKTYTPITKQEIIEANKKMAESIAGENWIAGFFMAVQLLSRLG